MGRGKHTNFGAKKLFGMLVGAALLVAAAIGATQSARAGLGERAKRSDVAALHAGVRLSPSGGGSGGGSGSDNSPSTTSASPSSSDGWANGRTWSDSAQDPNIYRLVDAPNGRLAIDPLVQGITGALGFAQPPTTGATIDLRGLVSGFGLDRVEELTEGLLGVGVDAAGLAFRFDPSVLGRAWSHFVGTVSYWWRSGVEQVASAPAWAMTWFDGDRPTPPPADSEMPARAVLLVHGLDDPGWIWDDLAPALCDAGHTAVRFEYSNDGPLSRSADALGEALTALRAHGVREVDIVAHSMGGLVVRDALTRPAWYDGDGDGGQRLPSVRRVITVGTPNHGAAIARFQGASELKERAIRLVRSAGAAGVRDPRERLLVASPSEGGHGEAGRDLVPGSSFLLDLNSRPLPRNVDFTIVAGRMIGGRDDEPVPASDQAPSALALAIERSLAAGREQVDGASDWLGDGLVTVDSAMLPGVDDVVLLRGNHQSLLMSLVPGKKPPAVAIIVERLGRE